MDKFRLAAKAFIVNDSKLLIVRRSADDVQQPDKWEIPGGRLEPGEDPVLGLKREIMEEAGIDVEVLHPFSVRHFTRADGQIVTLIIFLCRALSPEVKLSREHPAFEWVPLEKCKDKLLPFFHGEVDAFNKLGLYRFV